MGPRRHGAGVQLNLPPRMIETEDCGVLRDRFSGAVTRPAGRSQPLRDGTRLRQ
jgi:hypothetical protein